MYNSSLGSYGVSPNNNSIANDLISMIGSSSASRLAVSGFNSNIEQSILRSSNPIQINESEEITIKGERGIWLNKAEVNMWSGDLAINEYRIHEDLNPQIIQKRYEQSFEYIQELSIRYLQPPNPPTAGEIVIVEEPNIAIVPAPPLIIRQTAGRVATPEPLILREAPPPLPKPIAPKRIIIPGKRNPPPPRKVVIEKLAALPPKPQNVIIERWLSYSEGGKRRVFLHKAAAVAEVLTPKNVVVQWIEPKTNIRQEVKYLGVIRANPAEYVQKYGSELKAHDALPKFVQDIPNPREIGQLAWNYKSNGGTWELEGQLEGFQYLNLDNEGLSEYKEFLLSRGIRDSRAQNESESSVSSSGVTEAASKIFDMIDYDGSGEIEVFEAERIVLKLNSRLKRSYGENEVRKFFLAVSGGAKKIKKHAFVDAFSQLS